MIAFGIICGLATSFTSVIPQIVEPYNIPNDQAGFLGAGFIVAGVVGAIATGIFLDKYGHNKLIVKLYVPIVGITYLAFYFVGNVLTTII
jgi:FLVCR family MFS transporter 7